MPPKKAHATFRITKWDEQPYLEDSGMKLTRALVESVYEGDLVGTSSSQTLMVYRPDGSASFVGHERFVGTLFGEAGTFVLETQGTYVDGKAHSNNIIVRGAGTGALRELGGRMSYSVAHAESYAVVLEAE